MLDVYGQQLSKARLLLTQTPTSHTCKIVFEEADSFSNNLLNVYRQQDKVTDDTNTHFQLPLISFGEVDGFSNNLLVVYRMKIT